MPGGAHRRQVRVELRVLKRQPDKELPCGSTDSQPSSSSSYLLGIVPLVGGLLLGVIVLKLLKLAFFAIGKGISLRR